jgi:Ca-activated chloride channel family protein
MIYFENTQYLYLAWIIPILVIIYFLNHRHYLKAKQKLGEKRLINNLIKGPSVYLHFLKFMLLLLVFTALIVALANPTLPGKDTEAEPAKKEIIFVIDISNSMLVKDDVPNRLQKVKSFILEVVKALNGEQVGIVLFAGKASAYLPFTSDYGFVNSAVKSISNKMALQQGTSLREALGISSLFFNKKDDKIKVLCVLSDGESHTGNFEKLADSLRKSGINIFAFGAGMKAGGPIANLNPDGTETIEKDKNGVIVISHLHEENLLKITGNKANRYFWLSNKDTVMTAFISELKKIPDITNKNPANEKYFRFFLLIALFLLMLEFVLS